jgi:hypothetical protein
MYLILLKVKCNSCNIKMGWQKWDGNMERSVKDATTSLKQFEGGGNHG